MVELRDEMPMKKRWAPDLLGKLVHLEALHNGIGAGAAGDREGEVKALRYAVSDSK